MIGAAQARDLLDRHGLAARRDLGQNFVTDPGVVRRIARIAGVGPGSRVVEIGPGLGSLTLALVEAGARVLAIEKDPGLLGVLDEVLVDADPRPAVLQADALSLDWGTVLDTTGAKGREVVGELPEGGAAWTMVANLPYNVAVPILIRALAEAPRITRLVVMVQLEVAERLCASPGGRTIGVPTVKVAWFAGARIAMTVPPEVFVPRPRVRSAVVELVRRPEPEVGVRRTAFGLVDAAFAQRRKMLRSSLRSLVAPEAFAAAGVDPAARPEQLEVRDWARLSAEVPGPVEVRR